MHVLCDLDVPPRRYFEGMLHLCEHAPQSSNGQGDSAQNPQEIAPLVKGISKRLTRDGLKYGHHIILSSRGEAQQVGNHVQVLPEERLPGGPCTLSLTQIL